MRELGRLVPSACGSLWELIEARAAATPDAVFALDELGRTMRFGAFKDSVLAMAAGLLGVGVEPGSRVAWQLPTWLETATLAGALDRLGAVQVPVLPMLRRRELEFMVAEAEVATIAVPRVWNGFDHLALACDVASATGSGTVVVDRDGELPAGDPATLPAARPRPDDETTWIFYTSGTTSDPKGVRHGHRAVLASSEAMCDRMQIVDTDRSVVAFPLTHIGGINWLMTSMLTGCSLLLIERFAHPDTMPLIQRSGVTLAGVTTAFHQVYLAAQREDPDTPLLPEVRAYPGGAAPKPPALHHALVEEVGGVGIVSGYGLTEHPMVAMSSVDDPTNALATTEGHPSTGVQLDVVDPETGRACPPGYDGEFRLRGPHLMLGYVDESLHEYAFDDAGRFRTGDLGHLDADGRVVVTGRLKDVIVRKGENISAQEIENLLHDLDEVTEAAVVGVPDAERGERVGAVVVPAVGADIGLDTLCTALRARDLTVQKLPEALLLVDELPRSPTGKIRKDELRTLFAESL
ncbi:MAG: class I adenylate-forming enzyme family protein [Xanthomonadales bacterium]|nr:class I adenylate-forming enzyme family protein [Xanthomonadales bacterium]